MSRQELIARVGSASIELWVEGSNIFPSVRIAQAVLETGGNVPPWNNIFGIKAGSGGSTPYWDGRVVETSTREVIDGRNVPNVQAKWRAYDTLEDCIRDHELLLKQPRYASVQAASTPRGQCAALYAAGYATDAPTSVDGDPSYSEKLYSLIQSSNLTRFDTQAEETRLSLLRRLSNLEGRVSQANQRVQELRQLSRMDTIPPYARQAVNAAVAAGVVNTPKGGSFSFYRIMAVMKRKKLL